MDNKERLDILNKLHIVRIEKTISLCEVDVILIENNLSNASKLFFVGCSPVEIKKAISGEFIDLKSILDKYSLKYNEYKGIIEYKPESIEEKWMYELDDTNVWNGEMYDSREEAIENGMKEFNYRNELEKDIKLSPCKKFKIGRAIKVSPAGVDIDSILENIYENTTCHSGDVGNEFLDDVTEEDSKELEEKMNEVLFNWMKEHGYEPNFYTIEDVEEIEVDK